ncbi:MAG: TonB-dependent receptor [Deltaproteobacteria bacterium]|nr:TonB-dependent receptor [Deltaproteobacteria bacterium]
MTTIALSHSARAEDSFASMDAGATSADGAVSSPDAGTDLGRPSIDDVDASGHAVDFGVGDGCESASRDADVGASISPQAVSRTTVEETEPSGADRRTGIRGRIGDRTSGLPLDSAPVSALGAAGQKYSTRTDASGAYELFVPPGKYTVRSHYDMYHGVRMDGVPVARGHFAKANLVLDPIDIEEEVVVQEIEIPYRADTTTAAAQDELRKESRGIGEGMGSQQMSQQGAGDAGSAARRVVGVTLSGSQLVVRGLGGRYVKVVLNGLPIPTTDPDFPSVDLDLFPTSVIDSLNIQKVFLPDIPGDFAGGMLDLNTVSFPRKFLLSAGVSTGYNTETTFRKRLDYQGGGTDWLGFDDGTRSLPGVVDGKKLRTGADSAFPTAKDAEAAAEDFKNIWDVHRTNSLPPLGLSLALGDSIKLPHRRRVGYLASVDYDYSVKRQHGVSRPKPGISETGDAVETSHYDLQAGSLSAQLTAIGTVSLDLGLEHSLTALSMFNRSMDDKVRYRRGINAEVSNSVPYEKWQFQFLARTVLLHQLLGDHRNLLGTRARVRWGAYYGTGRREEPDQRTIAYGESGGLENRWRPSADRLWSDLSQTDKGANLQLRMPLWSEAAVTLGGRLGLSDRSFTIRRFQMQETFSDTDPIVYTQSPETLFSPDGLGTLTRMMETTSGKDSYVASQRSYAASLLVETPVVGALSMAGGARIEVNSQKVQSRSPFPDENTAESLAANRSERTDVDYLPGVAFKYRLPRDMFLRAAYAMTLSRPQVRELAPYEYYDFLRDRIIKGEPNLKTARIHNADLRWEWFFSEGQILAVSGFYKRFISPIELQIIGERLDSKYQNAHGATSLGAEFEVRSALGRVSRYLQRFEVGANLSLIHSRVDIVDTGATRPNRPLAGQAPYVANLSLRYLRPESRLSLGLVYNVVGPRITDVGTRLAAAILPDIQEQPFHSLDFVGSWGLQKHLKLKLKGRNLLGQSSVLKQGSLIAQEMYPGISFSVGLSYEH